MANSKILTLRLDQRDRNRLEKLAKATNRSRSYLAAEAIREYQEAFRKFPNPATAEKIHQLEESGLGL